MSEQPLIKRLDVTSVVIPLSRPMRTASGTLPGAALALVDIETDANITGRSYIFAYTPRMLRALETLALDIADVYEGKSIDPEARFLEVQSTFRLLGIQGLLGMLIAGIDMALWDAVGKVQDQPVVTLLGGAPCAVRAYDSYGIVDPVADEVQLRLSLEQGFTGIKIKIGGGPLDDDLARVEGVREIIGSDVALMVDYNQSLDVAEARARIAALKDFDVTWVEEPVPAEDLHGHSQLKADAVLPIQTGENWWFPLGAENAVRADACDLAMPDVMKIGGFTGWMRAIPHLTNAGIPISSHAFVEASAHALGATPNSDWLEWLDKASPILAEPYQVIEGNVTAVGSGLGMEWVPTEVDKYRI